MHYGEIIQYIKQKFILLYFYCIFAELEVDEISFKSLN